MTAPLVIPATTDAPSPDAPPRPAARSQTVRLARALAVVCLAALVPVWVGLTAPARGPAYLWFNMDSPYAYLLNSLRVAEGHSPSHTDHPGTTLQVLGAAALLSAHAFDKGGTPLRDAVLSDPERSLGHIRVAMTGAIALLSLAGGAMALRATGSLAHAVAIQATPFIAWTAASQLDRVQVEAPLIGIATAFGGATLMVIHRPPGFRVRRAAVALGLITATGIATKILFVPLGLVALVALPSWRWRAVYAGATAVFLALWTLPIALHIPRLVRWLAGIATHTGRYGAGENAIVDTAAYPRDLAEICSQEPVYPVIAIGALLAGGAGAILLRGGRGTLRGRLAACLLAAGAAQIALLLLVAKHPAVHYLTAGAGLCGLALSMAASLGAPGGSTRLARATVGVLLVTVAALLIFRWSHMVRWCAYARTMAERERAVAHFLRSPEGRGVLHGAQISTLEAALHFGNVWTSQRYGPDLERLYPGVFIWDRAGPAAFGRAPTVEESRRLWEGGALRAVVPRFFGSDHFRLTGLSIVTVRPMPTGQRLIRATPSPVVPSGTAEFAGFTALAGLGHPEPLVVGGVPCTVRWGLGEATCLRFHSTGAPLVLVFEARPNNRRGQQLDVAVDGQPVYTHTFGSRAFEAHAVRLHASPGDHELVFRYALPERAGSREVSVLFKRLQIVPAP